MRRRLVVVGGGISGLAAAQGAVDAAGPDPIDVLVLERDPCVGGKARTLRERGWLVEAGPTGYLDSEPAMERLIEVAGLADERITASAAAANRYIVRGGRPRRVTANPLALVGSGLLGPTGLLRLLGEPFVSRGPEGVDESVWEFAARRLGRQAADRLIAPMVLGVFAGDAKRVSLPAAFPRLAELEREHGSLVRGLIARRRRGGGGGPSGPAGKLTSFRDGLQSLPEALARRGAFRVRTGAAVETLAPGPDGGWRLRIEGDGEDLAAAAVVLTGEPWAMAPLVARFAPSLADRLSAIACPPVTVVALGFGPEALARVPRGFGVLVPRGEGYRLLGCLWDTHLFPGRSPEGSLLVRVMVGGAVDPEAALLPEDDLVARVREELARLLGLRDEPVFRRVIVWPRAIPQYEIDHLERLAAIEADLARFEGLGIAGNALHGVAFAKAAVAGLAAGGQSARRLLGPAARAGSGHVGAAGTAGGR